MRIYDDIQAVVDTHAEADIDAQLYEAQCSPSTPWCDVCHAATPDACKCPPIADNE